ncbi:MAG: hypothetical protein LVR00_09865 [Rhabdochlamydiaceae bacterium]|jgi:preprotein translocase subunit Sec63
MLVHDVYESKAGVVFNPTVAETHIFLGLHYDEATPATQAEIERAYRDVSRLIHPDKVAEFGAYNVQQLGELQKKVNNAKEKLMKHYRYA